MLNIGIFASGKGSNFEAILDAITAGKITNARFVVVISNNSGAGALVTARKHKIPAVHLSRKQFRDDTEFNGALLSSLQKHGVNFIALAGYMKKLDASLIRAFANRIVNIHPALLPAFGGPGMYGMHVHEAVLASGNKYSGATVHIVTEEYDAGPVILQERVGVSPGETAASLAQKVLAVEHRIYPEAIRLFAEGKISVTGDHRVTITP